MNVVEPTVWPAGLGEDIVGGMAGGIVWDMVDKEDSLHYSHGPVHGSCHIRPVDCLVEHHAASDVHHSSYHSLSLRVVVMPTCPSVPGDLLEFLQVLGILLGSKARTVVRDVRLNYHPVVQGMTFEAFLCQQGLVGGEIGLEFHMDIPRGDVSEYTAAKIHVLLCLTSPR
jgi:hypothetical protein